MATMIRCENRVIRKERQCYSCFRKFPKGAKMNYWFGKCGGDLQSNYACIACVEVMNMDTETEFPEGYVREMLQNGETPEQMIERWKIESGEKKTDFFKITI